MRILALDGGGSKGIYTLGVLKKLEQESGKRIHELFDVVYGTSTGAIIATFIALGRSAEEIRELYKSGVPVIMKATSAAGRSSALESFAAINLGGTQVSDFRIGIGIVASRIDLKRPMIFKSSVQAAHGSQGSFIPFFGVPVKDAVVASCSAVPFFKKKTVKTSNYETATLMDGGFCANNPSFFALADAIKQNIPQENITLLNIGVGSYPEKPYSVSLLLRFLGLSTLIVPKEKRDDFQDYLRAAPLMMDMTGASHQFLIRSLFQACKYYRISESCTESSHSTNFVDPSPHVMDHLFLHGLESWTKGDNGRALTEILDRLR